LLEVLCPPTHNLHSSTALGSAWTAFILKRNDR
jgi:hypothetical protein